MVKFTIKNSNPSGLEMTKELRALIVVAENSGFHLKTTGGSELPVNPDAEDQVTSSNLCGHLYS